jgi:endonuclease YncB( thermonuclease family)
MRRIDANTTEVANKKAGKATTTLRRTVSKDGKTLTITAKGKDRQGRTVNSVEVFDKQ